MHECSGKKILNINMYLLAPWEDTYCDSIEVSCGLQNYIYLIGTCTHTSDTSHTYCTHTHIHTECES